NVRHHVLVACLPLAYVAFADTQNTLQFFSKANSQRVSYAAFYFSYGNHSLRSGHFLKCFLGLSPAFFTTTPHIGHSVFPSGSRPA
ncbi:MAG: hypothetical protein RLN85_01055, partial [Pseudomonadales bacterium]